MTSQKSSSETRHSHLSFFDFDLFKFNILREWPQFLLYMILFLLFTVVFVILVIQNLNINYDTSKRYYLIGFTYNVGVISVVLSCFIAIFAGCSSMKYLNSKVGINFYHSLPVRRESLYIINFLSKFIYFIIAMFSNIAVSELILISKLEFSSDALTTLINYIGTSIILYLLFYFITIFAGTLSGTGGVKFVLTGIILFILPAVYASIINMIGNNVYSLWESYYISNDILKYICPPLYIFEIADRNFFDITELIVYLVLAIVFAVSSFILYIKRKSELSETPVIYKGAAAILKYSLMFVATFFTGLLFKSLQASSSNEWMIFGFICGAVLSFMLINTVLNKSARSMFKRPYGLVIFGAVFAVIFSVLWNDMLGFETRIPSVSGTSKIQININGADIVFEDRTTIQTLHSGITRYLEELEESKSNSNGTTLSSETYEYADISETEYIPYGIYDNSLRLNVVLFSKLGFPYAKSIDINKDEYIDILKAIADSNEYKTQYRDFLSTTELDSINIDMVNICTPSENIYNPVYLKRLGNNFMLNDESYNLLLDKAKSSLDFDSYQRPNVGHIYTHCFDKRNYYTINYPIFAENSELFKEYNKMVNASENSVKNFIYTGDFYQKFSEYVESIEVTNNKNTKTYSDKESIIEILKSSAYIGDKYTLNDLTVEDSRYMIKINLTPSSSDFINETGDNIMYTQFLYTKVPEFIKNDIK